MSDRSRLFACAILMALCQFGFGQIFVVDFDTNAVAEYSLGGSLINSSFISGLAQPEGIAISGGNIFVSNFQNSTIGKYTLGGGVINKSFISGLSHPLGIAVSGNTLFVVNFDTNSVGAYDATTTPR
jgi:hypothetical protein